MSEKQIFCSVTYYPYNDDQMVIRIYLEVAIQ